MIRAGFISFFLSAVLASPIAATAQACPRPPDIRDQMDVLFSLVQQARNEGEARPAVNGMWLLWTRAPDAKAQALLDDGRAKIRLGDHEAAAQALSDLVDYCPDYAEGYNQRAFANFLQGDYQSALGDLDAALMRNPRHVAALSGKFLTLHALGRREAAQESLRAALTLNPWIPERRMLAKPKGTAL